jgi:hypothetical protein
VSVQDRSFFEEAIKAAKKSPDAFKAEFKKPEAKADVRENGDWGDFLIHTLIRKIPDENLPALLTILVEQKANLESYNDSRHAPLALAALSGKKKAIDFLLEQKVKVDDQKNPALCCAISSPLRLEKQVEIINSLLLHGADINIQSNEGFTPLIDAVILGKPSLVKFLLSKNADLFLKQKWENCDQTQTALGIAYDQYIRNKEVLGDNDNNKINKDCFDILLRHAAIKCLELNPFVMHDSSILKKYLEDLAGNFTFPSRAGLNSKSLLIELEKTIPALIKKEQWDTFASGSRLTAKQKENPPAVYRLFQQNDGRNLSRLIFSFLHGTKPKEAKVSDVKASQTRKP